MSIATETLIATPANAHQAAPGVVSLALIFWFVFAAVVTASAILVPDLYVRQDPDSALRLVQVRDLLAGQGWFDLVQRRFDPPDGILMHWSRLIDAPIAALIVFGDLFGNGERFALVAWPLLLFLGFLVSALYVATAFGGPSAAAPTAILALLFIDPMLTFLPGNTDHHNAQLALILGALACALRMRERPMLGLAAGSLCALMLAIGLEMLPYVAAFGAFVALRWAISGEPGRSTALFAAAIGFTPALLYVASGSPDAAWACDSLSWAYAAPLGIAGSGLAFLAHVVAPASFRSRLAGLCLLLVASAAVFLSAAPHCAAGPYGALSLELKTLWLNHVTEAQPIFEFAARQPEIAIALMVPPSIALALACLRAVPAAGSQGAPWALTAALLALALALSFYQVRTIPYANALAIPVLGAWLAQQGSGTGPSFLRRHAPVIAAFLIALPMTHLALGWVAVTGVSAVSGGRFGPTVQSGAAQADTPLLSVAREQCSDPGSVRLLAGAHPGLVLAPVFYGPTLLEISAHSAVAGPYHRAGAAILDAIHALRAPPDGARRIVETRRIDYVAICTSATETKRTLQIAPDGLAAQLLGGREIGWLQPVVGEGTTALRLWRVLR